MQERKHAPPPVAFFPSAVSAPHLYAIAVMKLYVQHNVGAAKRHTRHIQIKASVFCVQLARMSVRVLNLCEGVSQTMMSRRHLRR